MPNKLKIITKSAGTFSAELTGENFATADAIYAKLQIEGKANVWGEEIYFSNPVTIDLESAKPLVDVGDIAYWPPGRAICLFFGPTPASWDKEIRAASRARTPSSSNSSPLARRYACARAQLLGEEPGELGGIELRPFPTSPESSRRGVA